MATRAQVDQLQANLIAAEKAWKSASAEILQAAQNEVGLASSSIHGLKALRASCLSTMSRFHKQSELCSLDVGVAPQSSPGDKDDDED